MLPTIENSDKFKTDYNNFKSRIACVTNENIKTELLGMLTQLLREVRAIDSQHMEIVTRKELPSFVTDTRSKITEVRKSLVRRLEDWERANPK